MPPPSLPDRPPTPIERKAIDYSDLEQLMAHADLAIRDTRRVLDALARGEAAPASPRSRAAPTLQSQQPFDDLPESWLGGNGTDDHE